MSYSGNGTYTLPEADFVAGTLIRASEMNSDLGDIESALTSVGQGTVNPSITLTALPSNVLIGGPTHSILALTETNLNAGTNFIYGTAVDFIFGGGFGGRVADVAILAQTSATNAANTNREYVGHQGISSTSSGDGGTNTGAGALGTYVGDNSAINFISGGVNIAYGAAHEANVNLFAGSTSKDAIGYHCLLALSVSTSMRPARMFHGYTISCATSISVNHVHMAYSISDQGGTFAGGGSPVGPQTVALFGSTFNTVTTPVSVSSGIKLTDFTFAGNAFSSTGFSVGGTGDVTLNSTRTPSTAVSVTTTSGNNLAVSSGYMRIINTPGTFDITGFVAQSDGYVLRVYNTTANNMNIINDATSTAANRIFTLTGATVALTGTCFASFVYDTGNSRWILTGTQG